MQDEKQLRTDAFNAFMKLSERDLISDEPLFREMTRYYSMYFKGGMGAEAVRDLLAAIDLPSEAEKLKAIIADEDSQKQKREKAVKRLEVVDAFLKGGNSPANMIWMSSRSFRLICARWSSSTAAASPHPTSTTCTVA